ncbi:hypothetical protein E2C01_068327 [Portunus trituberculatus]|uniref:Uncharacterized protein n=1 Tax=Portunus trituberculatus TaxID=210409 RepID=A0A5B7HVH6_PORTR|nr:hypothetical protein [Portunus trituberculatus]
MSVTGRKGRDGGEEDRRRAVSLGRGCRRRMRGDKFTSAGILLPPPAVVFQDNEEGGCQSRYGETGVEGQADGGWRWGASASPKSTLAITVDNRFNLGGMIDNLSIPVMLSLHNTLLLISHQDQELKTHV